MTGSKELVQNCFRRYWLEGIQEVSIDTVNQGFKEYLSTGDALIFSHEKEGWLIFDIIDEAKLKSSFVYEFSKFQISADESLDSSSLYKQKKSISWPAIKNYYASFFSAHAVMRLSGWFHTYSPELVDSLNDKRETFSMRKINTPLLKGYYFIEAGVPRIKLKEDSSNSHEGLWKHFAEYLKNIEKRAKEDDLAIFIDELAIIREILDGLCEGGSLKYNWLTGFRNKVNYLNDLTCWFPFSLKSKNTRDKFDDLLNKWKKNVPKGYVGNKQSDDLESFFRLCHLISSLSRQSVEAIRIFTSSKDENYILTKSDAYTSYSKS